MSFQGITTSIAKEPYSFVIFQRGGGGGRTPCPPLDPRKSGESSSNGNSNTTVKMIVGKYIQNVLRVAFVLYEEVNAILIV